MCNSTNLQITKGKLDELKEYKTASFAVWLNGNDERTKYINNYIENSLEKLKSNIILLALNPSKEVKSFCNFHDGSETEIFLRDTISECEALKGAYMTDISQVEKSTSYKVEISDDDIEKFKEQLKILGEKEYFVVCFGIKVFTKLLDGKKTDKKNNVEFATVKLDGYTLHCFKVFHYTHVLKYEPMKKPKLVSQLKEVNERIKNFTSLTKEKNNENPSH
jgi:MoaA/NifB/PqqE/SkfB family radical SAM enzyme